MGCEFRNIPDDAIGRIIRNEFRNKFCDDFILVGEDETCMAKHYLNFAESIKNFEVRNSDVMVCSFPKSGTTWTQEMVWLIMNDFDYEGAKIGLNRRFPFLEFATILDFEKLGHTLGMKSPDFVCDSIKYCNQQKSPRLIKSHLPYSLLPEDILNGDKTPKIIYVVRNPKDVCVSYYHHGKIFLNWQAGFEQFSQVFLAGRIMHGCYWKSVLGYWERRDSPNLLIISYEDMKKDLRSVVEKVAKFLDKELMEEQVESLLEHLSFESMKNNSAVNREEYLDLRKEKNLLLEEGKFIRSGSVDKYKEEMSQEMIEKFDAWIKENNGGSSFGHQFDYIV